MRRLRLLFAVLLPLACVRADLLPLAGNTALKSWSKKSNVSLSRQPDGALEMNVHTGVYDYGWAQCPLPRAEMPKQPAGVYGRVRVAPGTRAQLSLSLILAAKPSPAYYGCDLGPLSGSPGDGAEFYAPWSSFRAERDASARPLDPKQFRDGDRLQIALTSANGEPATAVFDRLRILDEADAATIGRSVRRASLARLLLPEPANAGASHPRLLLTPDRLQRIRAKVAAGGEAQAVYAALLKTADGYLKSLDPDDPFQGVLHFEPAGHVNAHQRSAQLEGRLTAVAIPIEILSAAYRLTGDERYGRHAAKALATAARTLDTDNAVLNSGFYYTRTFYVRALAFGYDWLWPLLTPQERRDVKATLLGFVLQIHADSGTANWGRRPLHRVWNWDPGLVSCAGLGLLALEGETAAPEKAVLFDLRRHLRDYLTLGIDRDGAGHEGPGYLAYGIGAGPEFAECLRVQGRGDLFTETNWQLIPTWLTAETLPDHARWNNLSDCSHGENPAAVYSYTCGRLAELARASAAVPGERLPAPEPLVAPKDYLWQFAETPGPRLLSYPALASLMGWEWETGGLGRRIAAASAPAQLAYLLFYEACPATQPPSALLPDALHFRGRGLAVSRTGYGPDDLLFAVEAGPHAAGHDQADKGSFTLYGYGADLAIDSGYGNDGEPQKSGSSFAHNMVLIDGRGEPMTWHNQSSGHITGYRTGALLDWVRVDAREAWNVRYDGDWRPQPAPHPVDKAVRQFLFVRGHGRIPPYLVVMDDLRKNGEPADYTWLWHIPADRRFRLESDRWVSLPMQFTGSVLTTTAEHAKGGARFVFHAPSAGRYVFAGLVRAAGDDVGKSDSFYVSINGGRRLTWNLACGNHFGWEPVIAHETGDTNALALKAGETVSVDLFAREPQAQLAKLALVPADARFALAPDEQPNGAVTLTAGDAELLKPALLRQPLAPEQPNDARLTVFPVTTDARRATNDWFETSREGLHPRLAHTVRAVEPKFLMVLVPGTSRTPLPQVRRLAMDAGVGTELVWDGATDQILFGSGEPLRAADLATDGHAAFVRREAGRAVDWQLLDGQTLTVGGQRLQGRE